MNPRSLLQVFAARNARIYDCLRDKRNAVHLRKDYDREYNRAFRNDVGNFIDAIKKNYELSCAELADSGHWKGKSGPAQALKGQISASKLQFMRDRYEEVVFPPKHRRLENA